ncbi:nuclear factor interleukin-3-regulated protein [Vombatus ursinus]|uniref:nuclear factor interleukin-3-regulated protein n=1 Tax=Vombatus ursinus TaxID=29139 RepID=UPI000FFD788C|nr:nuclear factor interleukin-3-regulated protein [Vombatus ursinus]
MDLGLLRLMDLPQGKNKALRGNRRSSFVPATRRQREFMPEEKKDTTYWEKRRKNNEAAKRSREKRRLNDVAVEGRLAALKEENASLRAELLALKFHFGLLGPGTPQALQALLWSCPWPASRGPEGKLALPDRGPLRPCSPDPKELVLRDYGSSHEVVGLGSPGLSHELSVPDPKRPDSAVCSPAFFSYHLPDGHTTHLPLLEPSPRWGPSVPTGQGKSSGHWVLGSNDGLLVAKSGSAAPSSGTPCPHPGGRAKTTAQSSLPHKLRIKSKALADWEDSPSNSF